MFDSYAIHIDENTLIDLQDAVDFHHEFGDDA